MTLPKHIRLEPKNRRSALPGITGQARFEARLGEELIRRPAPLRGDLRKEQASMPSLLDDEAVTPDDDGVWDAGVDWFERPEDGDVDRDPLEFRWRNRRESRVGTCRISSAPRNVTGEATGALQRAEAPAKLAVHLDGDEGSGGVRERDRRHIRRSGACHLRLDCGAREIEQRAALGIRQERRRGVRVGHETGLPIAAAR